MSFEQTIDIVRDLEQQIVEMAEKGDWQELQVLEAECQQWLAVLSEWPDLDIFQLEKIRRLFLSFSRTYRNVLTLSIYCAQDDMFELNNQEVC